MTNEKVDTQLKQDYLYEMSGIYNDKIYVGVNPDSKKDWFKNEYFNVFNNPSYRKAELAARIEFRVANYLPNNETKQNWILNDADKQVLISFLKSSSVNFPNITNWQECILYFNQQAFNISYPESMGLTKDIQKQLSGNDKRKQALPIDLEMPDYKKL